MASGEKDLSERFMLRRGRFLGQSAPDHRIPEDQGEQLPLVAFRLSGDQP